MQKSPNEDVKANVNFHKVSFWNQNNVCFVLVQFSSYDFSLYVKPQKVLSNSANPFLINQRA